MRHEHKACQEHTTPENDGASSSHGRLKKRVKELEVDFRRELAFTEATDSEHERDLVDANVAGEMRENLEQDLESPWMEVRLDALEERATECEEAA